MMTPRQVVLASLDGLERGRSRVVVGLSNRVLAFLAQRLAPGRLARGVSGYLYRPRARG
jgi:hypothetical protein